MTDQELFRNVLCALEQHLTHHERGCAYIDPVVDALRARLAQPEPEPVAWHEPEAYGNVTVYKNWAKENGWQPLYTAPPQRVPDLSEVKRIATQLGWKPPVDKAPEPVAWAYYDSKDRLFGFITEYSDSAYATNIVPLYTAPPQREWQGLTDEEIRNEANHHVFDESFFNGAVWARGKIKEKNNG
jgi:hypothetical protein